MKTSYVTLQVADGTTMAAYAALPENVTANTPAIIVFQEAFGVNGHIRKITEHFANEGFIAIAPELFHRGAPEHFEVSYHDFDTVRPHLGALTIETLEADSRAAYNWLTSQTGADTSRIFSVGYCMGGRASFLANATLPLKAAVSYYGGGLDPLLVKAPDLSGRHLFFWGGLDKHIPKESIDGTVQALADAGKPYINVVFSDADHRFNCDERASYHADASKQAWGLTLQFLKDN